MIKQMIILILFFLIVFSATAKPAVSDGLPLALGRTRLPNDSRLYTDAELPIIGHLPFVPSETVEVWEDRAEYLRRQIKVSLGLWPMPTRTPLNAVIHGHVERDDYTVEKVYFQSIPGHYVTGNLYRPKVKSQALRPAVLCPYGHWKNGRFNKTDDYTFARYLKDGQEHFDPSGRYPLQARCVQLARMGCVVFIYDMVGYADSVQLPHRPEPRDWGYGSAQAHLHLQNLAGLQTFNSIRALDFISGLEGVDPKRIAVTGASGGGIQTLMLFAVDERPVACIPVVSVFISRRGAPCTYGPYMRIEEGTIGLAALTAPRPLCVINAGGDWTRDFMFYGHLQLKQLYRLLGIEDLFTGKLLLKNPHNYNALSRWIMYEFVNKHLKLGLTTPIIETDFKPLLVSEMTVWNKQHPKPSGDQVGDTHEHALLNWLTQDSLKQLDALIPKDAPTLDSYCKVVGGAVDIMIGRHMPDPATLRLKTVSKKRLGSIQLTVGLLSNTEAKTELPLVLIEPFNTNGQVIIWVHPEGKSGLFNNGTLRTYVERLLKADFSVIGVDLLYQGEFLREDKPLEKTTLLKWKGKPSIDYTLGNRRPLFSERVFDILTVLSFVRNRKPSPTSVHLVGLDGTGHWVAAARAQAGNAIDKIAIDTDGFRFAQLNDVQHLDFLPGAAKYHDLPGMLALGAPHKLWLAGEKAIPVVLHSAYIASNANDNLTLYSGEKAKLYDAAIDWFLQ